MNFVSLHDNNHTFPYANMTIAWGYSTHRLWQDFDNDDLMAPIRLTQSFSFTFCHINIGIITERKCHPPFTNFIFCLWQNVTSTKLSSKLFGCSNHITFQNRHHFSLLLGKFPIYIFILMGEKIITFVIATNLHIWPTPRNSSCKLDDRDISFNL